MEKQHLHGIEVLMLCTLLFVFLFILRDSFVWFSCCVLFVFNTYINFETEKVSGWAFEKKSKNWIIILYLLFVTSQVADLSFWFIIDFNDGFFFSFFKNRTYPFPPQSILCRNIRLLQEMSFDGFWFFPDEAIVKKRYASHILTSSNSIFQEVYFNSKLYN